MFNQYSSLEFLPLDNVNDESTDVKIPPPVTYEEWLKYNNIETWPIDPLDEINDKSWLQLNVGTLDDLRNEVKQKVPCQINILDEILNQVELLDEKMKKYADYFFTDTPRRKTSDAKAKEKYIQSHGEGPSGRRESHIQKKKESLKARNMEFASFPGFHNESSLLPGALEAPQLLNNITKFQNFPPVFRKLWKNFFLSEASVGILQDAFWWLFLEYSKPTKKANHLDDISVSQSKLFDRMANNFVGLFISIPYHVKDCFFRYYPDCLSQAIYSAFFVAFPLSTSKFNLDFRECIVGLIYEWVCGTQPQNDRVLKTWNLEVLEGQNQISVDSLDEPLQVLKSHLSFNEETFLDFSCSIKEEITDLLASPLKKQESHPAGAGAEFSKLSFNVFGQSPFVKHYLSRKHLQNEDEILNKIVTRTERNEKKLIDFPTYNELIKEHKLVSKARKKKHDQVIQQVSQEVRRCNKKQKDELRSMKKLQKDLLKGHFDIKILSQKILDMMDVPDIAGKHFVTEN